ncbi:hypothetical protein KFE25_004937 [Diacronema lutheri]|uniref:FYVE-type domain-containing protein n=1 Tax=Diacronema lutheri TaxID=2081491 RepID=A0A8J5XD81_DIALT|nr:hypothetical protein KFE25_004937 [Diacronema lutheri]
MSSRFRCCPCAFHEEVDEEPPRRSGVLTKQGDSGRRRWVDRLFILDDRRFLYREGESADGPVRQATELTPSCTAEIAVDEEGVSILVLSVPHADLQWRMRARGGLPELRAWQTALLRAIRPRWADQLECNCCQGRFSVLRWRHHCRRCGFCVCAACSTRVSSLRTLGYDEPTTLCSLCAISADGDGRGGGALAKLPPHAITLRIAPPGQRAGARDDSAREPLLPRDVALSPGGGGGGPTAALAAAASALSSLLPAGAQRQLAHAAERPPAQTHAERIRIKYGIGAAGAQSNAAAHAADRRSGSAELAAVPVPQQPARGAESHLCVICLEADAVIAALPCGHRALCARDSQALGLRSPCPVCRQTIEQFQRIY